MASENDLVALRPDQVTIPPGHPWNRLPLAGGVCALLGAVACAILGAGNPKQFFFSWLVSFLFFLSLAVGALFFVLIQYATQGGWSIVLRRIGETTFATIPVMAALFVPLLFGLHDLYSWSVPGAAEHDALLRCKAPYLNVPFFLIRGLLDTVISAEHLQDIGKRLFAFMVFWTYIGFSQFFLIWYGNLPEETIWYRARMEGSWLTASIFLMAGHFVAPFLYLMGRAVKRRGSTLAVGGAWLLAMHFVDLYWQVMPTLH